MGRKTKISPRRFTEVFNHFQRYGTVKDERSRNSGISQRTAAFCEDVQREITQNPKSSTRKISEKLNASRSKVRRTLRFDLKMYPYKFHRSQILNSSQKEQRLNFCNWILEHEIDPNKIIFSDEKWFQLDVSFNRQNVRYWSTENPHAYDASVKQGAEKVMAWAGIVNGCVLPIVWFQRGISVNSQNYLELLQNNMWPSVENNSDLENYFFQQDGATPHCAQKCLDFLLEKFPERVISRRTSHPWPASSPDLNLLDFWFWGEMEQVIQEKQPTSIDSLKAIVDEAAASMEPEKIHRACQNFRRRVEMCRLKEGGHFESNI